MTATSQPTGTEAQEAFTEAGLEVFAVEALPEGWSLVQIAERVRLHLMDSGVRVRIDDGFHVWFTARSQESEFPDGTAEELIELVRNRVGKDAVGRGYSEVLVDRVRVTDPVDDSKVLDVWHEVRYERQVETLEAAVAETKWALSIDKYVSR